MALNLRIRGSKGQQNLTGLRSDSTFFELLTRVQALVTAPSIQNITVKAGFPPATINPSDLSASLDSVGITSGLTLTIEVDTTTITTMASSAATKPTQQQVVTKPAQQQVPASNSNTSNNSNNNNNGSFTQTPDRDGLIMIRRVIPADNSCLFNCLISALETNSKKRSAYELRHIVSQTVREPDNEFTAAILEKSKEEYANWILKDTSWGGSVELVILSKLYDTQLAVVAVQTGRVDRFGSAPTCVYLLYDGIHYDLLVRNIAEDMPAETDIRTFNSTDSFAESGCLVVARELKHKKAFTDVQNFDIQCGVCGSLFKGQEEALKHSKLTSHINFQQISN